MFKIVQGVHEIFSEGFSWFSRKFNEIYGPFMRVLGTFPEFQPISEGFRNIQGSPEGFEGVSKWF